MSKEAWFAIYERMLDEGVDEDEAAEAALEELRERYADMADQARNRARENRE